jgi:hypothetical protein
MTKLPGFIAALLILLACPGQFARAQEKSDSIELAKAAKAVCNCITKRQLAEISDGKKLEGEFVLCMLDSAGSVFMTLMMNEEEGGMEKAGEELGKKVAFEMMRQGCPDFLKISMRLAGGGDAEPTKNAEEETTEVNGKVSQVTETDFLVLQLKSEAGREYKVFYLRYVPDSDDWLKDPRKLIGKTVEAVLVNREYYDPISKNFVVMKELKSLKIR